LRLVEKYRPKTWEDIVGQETVIKSIRATLKRNWGLPHYLFIGPPGCGKTSVAEVMAKELGLEFHEFNASDERGIDFIRGEIKRLSQFKGARIIFLDEADQLTGGAGSAGAAQHAMRRIMEQTEESVFVLTGNEEWKIIDAIKSRCAIFRFPPLKYEDIEKKLIEIIRGENIPLDADTEEKQNQVRAGLKRLIDRSQGDLRTAINDLETIIDAGGQITPESVAVLGEAASLHVVALRYALDGNFEAAKDTIEKAHISGRFDSRLTFRELYKALETVEPKEVRIRLYSKLGEVEANAKRGSDPIIQIIAYLAYVWVCPHLTGCPVLDQNR